MATVHHSSPVRTVMPPMMACTTVGGRHQPGVDQDLAAPVGAGDANTAAIAVSTTANVTIRLPNSTAWWMRGTSGCGPARNCREALGPGRAPEARRR